MLGKSGITGKLLGEGETIEMDRILSQETNPEITRKEIPKPPQKTSNKLQWK